MIEYNVFNILRGETPEDVEREKAIKDLQEEMSQFKGDDLKQVQEEILVDMLIKIEDDINAFIFTCKSAKMWMETPEQFREVAKRIEKDIAFSDQYKEDTPEVREHLKAYLTHVLELIIASFNSHNV